MKNYILVSTLCLAFAINITTSYAQHTLQVDNGPGKIGIFDVSFLPSGITLYTLPSTGGVLVTLGSGNTNPWLMMGNSLTNAGPNPMQWIGTSSDDDVILKTNNSEKLRLVSAGGIVISDNTSIVNQGELRFMEQTANGTDHIALRAPSSLIAPYTLTFPPDNGTSGQVLTNDGLGRLSWTTPSSSGTNVVNTTYTGGGALSTNTNDLTVGTSATLFRIQNSSGAPIDLTGLDATGSADGRVIILINTSSDYIIIRHNTGSLAGNKFDLPGGTDVLLGSKGSATFTYDQPSGFWELLSTN